MHHANSVRYLTSTLPKVVVVVVGGGRTFPIHVWRPTLVWCLVGLLDLRQKRVVTAANLLNTLHQLKYLV